MSLADHSGAVATTRTIRYETIVRSSMFVFIVSGVFVFVEPSPYDITSIIAMIIWFLGGFKVHRTLIPILALMLFFAFMGFVTLMPYWDEPDPRLYQLQSLYLVVTTFFFAIYFSEQTIERTNSMLKAFTLGAAIAAIVGLFSYLDIFGLGFMMPYEGRAAGTFKDPNVFGSYLIVPVNYLLQALLMRRGRFALVHVALLGLMLVGIFLSFSRGTWGATIVSSALVVGSAYATSTSRHLRRQIALMTGIGLFLVVVAFVIVLTIPDLSDFLGQRVKLTQEYDEGVTGRFGNQLRSIPMLLERFWGFGPLRYRLIFDLEPHNSYIGGFANDGWLGGLAWIGIVVMTGFVGFRLMILPSPVRTLAQVVWPGLFVYFLQGFQIDIDHWRQLFLCIGTIWGLEVARQRWSRTARPSSIDRLNEDLQPVLSWNTEP